MPLSQPDHNQPPFLITNLQSTKQLTQPKNTTQPDQKQPFLITGTILQHTKPNNTNPTTLLCFLIEDTKAQHSQLRILHKQNTALLSNLVLVSHRPGISSFLIV